jgi:hypothetical protein
MGRGGGGVGRGRGRKGVWGKRGRYADGECKRAERRARGASESVLAIVKSFSCPPIVFAHGRVKMTLTPMASQNVYDEHGGAAQGSAHMCT